MTLLAKIYGSSKLEQVDKNLKSVLEGLKVETKILGTDQRGWVRLSISGEDEKVAARYLGEKIGICPTDLGNIGRFSTFKGFALDPNKSKNELWSDIGVSGPTVVDAAIPLHRLQAQLGDGRKIALGKFSELFGFCKNLPLHVRVTAIELEKGYLEAELSEKQLKQFADWTRSLLDRLLVLGASRGRVNLALQMAESSRDVVELETLGMFEHAIVCKLGTDAAGLIPKIGRNLRRAAFSVFSPRKIVGFLGKNSALSIS